MELTITKGRFLEWYFEYGQDSVNERLRLDLADRIINQLFVTGVGTISVEELFLECYEDAIRFSFTEQCKDEDNDDEIGDLFKTFNIKLV